MRGQVDRASALPLYAQLKDALLDEMQRAGSKPGDRLPTEGEIETRFGVSRTTVRLALQALAHEGIVERIQGRGTFVAAPKISHQPMLTSFTENMRLQGLHPSRRALVSELREAPDRVGSRLELRADDRTCRFLRRLLLADERPVGVAETWLPVGFVGPGDEVFNHRLLNENSLYDLLRWPSVGLNLERGEETVRSALAEADDADLLECCEGDPVLIVDRTSFNTDGKPVELTRLTFDGARYQYRTEVRRPGDS